MRRGPNRRRDLIVAASAAFCVYFCMYAFRKPFTAATFEGDVVFGLELKSVLVISQLAGYMISKFIGIKVVSELRSQYRAGGIVVLILWAEIALVGFALVPLPLKGVMLFFNGLPLGMVFGLVLAYLEGRKQTEALSAALCASFIVSSGFVKSVGRLLIENYGISEFAMPMVTGLIFLPALLLSVWFLHRTPPQTDEDCALRSRREPMTRRERRAFLTAYWPGLALLMLVYIAVTVVRSMRDDYAVEIWRDLGVTEVPSVFTTSEIVVALVVTALNGLAILIVSNRRALAVTALLMGAAFALSGAAAVAEMWGATSPFGFMVACGVGLYIPYVAFHTTVFERLIAVSGRPCNLGFLMYVADALGYLGYGVVLVIFSHESARSEMLPLFQRTLLTVGVVSIVALIGAMFYFDRVLTGSSRGALATAPSPGLEPVVE